MFGSKFLLLSAILSFGLLGQGWKELPNTSIVLNGLCPPGTSGNCTAVVAAWSGAVADTKRNRLILFGGGHGDYNGNEVYALYLSGAPSGTCASGSSPTICRIKDPSSALRGLSDLICHTDETDGLPNSRHTYGGVAYIASSDKMYVNGGSVTCGNGQHFSDTWTLDLASLTWSSRDPANSVGATKPSDWCSTCGSTGQGPWVNAEYDPNTQLVFLDTAQSGNLWKYEESTNTYTLLTSSLPVNNLNQHAVIDPVGKFIYYIGNPDGPATGDQTATGTALIRRISIASGSSYSVEDVTSSVTGCDGLLKSLQPGLAWNSKISKIVGWPNFGNSVYVFDPVALSCVVLTYPGGPPDSKDALGTTTITTGTFGRFQYFPSLDEFVVINDARNNAFVLTLSNGISLSGNLSVSGGIVIQ